MTRAALPIAVAVSGGGRTLENLLQNADRCGYHVAAIISSRPDCPAAIFAKRQNIPLWSGEFSQDLSQNIKTDLDLWVQSYDVELIALAGFLKPFPILHGFQGRIVNIHPALLPYHGGQGMYGARVNQAVWQAKLKFSGATVHYVSERYDEGQIIAQIRVSIEGLTSAEAIAERVFTAECRLYPEVISRLLKSQLPLKNNQIQIFQETEL